MKKNLLIITFLVVGLSLIFTGSYAYYRFVINATITASTGNAIFTLKDSNNEDLNNKVITLNEGNKVKPGDNGSFNITLDATGSTVDMYVSLEIDKGTLPTNLRFYTTKDKKTELHKYYKYFKKDETLSETLTIYWYWNPYISDEEDNKFINKDSLEATIKVNAVQVNEYAVMKNDATLETTNGEVYIGDGFRSDTYRPYIRTIKFDNNLSGMPTNCTAENLCWDITETGSKKKVYGYLVDSGLKDSTDTTKALYNLYIVSDGPIFAPTNCTGLFSFMQGLDGYYSSNLVSINFNDNFNTSNVTNMNFMFIGNTALKSLDLSSFNTTNVTSMEGIFSFTKSLKEINLSSFNTINLTNSAGMFAYCESLENIDLSNFNTSNITTFEKSYLTRRIFHEYGMFSNCISLTELDLSSFNTSKAQTMKYLFYNCKDLTTLDLSGFNTSNVTNMLGMFEYCTSLTKLDLRNFNTSKVTDMSEMFKNCTNLKKLNIQNFNTTSVIDLTDMFRNSPNIITTINIMNADITNYSLMFNEAATGANAKITVNYTVAASTIVDSLIATKSANSNVIKGNQL